MTAGPAVSVEPQDALAWIERELGRERSFPLRPRYAFDAAHRYEPLLLIAKEVLERHWPPNYDSDEEIVRSVLSYLAPLIEGSDGE